MKNFRIHETHLGLSDYPLEDQPGPANRVISDMHRGPWTVYLGMLKLLRQHGWAPTDQSYVRKHARSLSETKHAGAKGKLRFNSSIAPGISSFEFYEDVVRDNQYGGQYHFNKLQKMPYLDRLRLKATFQALREYLVSQGYEDQSESPCPNGGMAYLDWMRESHWKGRPDVYTDPPDYNSRAGDGTFMKNGDFMYYRNSWGGGYIGRGLVFNDGNNMWIVIPNDHSATRLGSSDFFREYDPKMPRRWKTDERKRVAEALQRAINRQDFLRAHKIQQYLNKAYGCDQIPKAGDTVRVEYGERSAKYLAPVTEVTPLAVACRLESGIRWFPRGMVTVVQP